MKRILSDPQFYFYSGVILLLAVLLPYFISFDYLLINSKGLFIQREIEITILCFIVLLYFIFFKSDSKRLMGSSLFALLLGVISYLLCQNIYDFSFDGQGYHQDAIYTIADGWNYFYDVTSASFHDRWIDHYPKASWLSSAFYLKLFGNIEGAKFINLLLMLSSALISVSCLKSLGIKSTGFIVLISLLIGFDPINLNSFLSFMNDGQVSSLLILSFLLVLNYRINPSEAKLFLVAMCLVYLINIKLSAGVYALALVLGIVLYDLFTKQFRKQDEFYITIGIAILLGFCLWGYNPYITNFKNQGHVFYPIYGNQNEEVLGVDYLPRNFKNDLSLVKVSKSIFAKTAFSAAFNKEAALKAPFMVDKKELETYAANGVMLGGLGPLFSGLFLICCFLFIPLILYSNKGSNIRLASIIIVGGIFVSVFFNPMGWWFRFVPQLWYFIVLVAVLLNIVLLKRFFLLKNILIGLMFINLSMMGAYLLYQPMATNKLNKRLSKLKKESVKEVLNVDFGQHERSFSQKLKNYSIKYSIKEENNLLCPNPEEIKLLDVKLCLE